MLTRMNETPKGDPQSPASSDGPNVLAGLPRARPHRSSPRRAAAREARARKGPAPSTDATATNGSTAVSTAVSTTPIGPTKPARSPIAPVRPAKTPRKQTSPVPTPAEPRPARPTAKRRAPKRRPEAPPLEPSVPRQGFEAEPDHLTGPVQPPGGVELVASAGELAGELAKAGITTGTRLLKDFLSHLPG
jgi:hypothetical protein